MTYIISEPCIDIKDKSCVDVCPVDCIHEFDRMLVIDPEECIDCGACEPECPWQAIFEEAAVPTVFTDDVKLNAAMVDARDSFEVSPHEEKPKPSAEEIEANKKKWSWAG